MKRIVIGGQIDKAEILKDIQQLTNGNVIVEVKSDLDAAMAMKANQYDYYVGACNTGGGGALAMAMALLGKDKCATVSMPGVVKDETFIRDQFKQGKVAFGFTAQHRSLVLPIIIEEIMK